MLGWIRIFKYRY